MPLKCTCPETCKLHDTCDCGNRKQSVSDCCRNCYANPSTRKTCCLCKVTLPASSYHKNSYASDKLNSSCKQCVKTNVKIPCSCGGLMERKSKLCIDCYKANSLKELQEDSRTIYSTFNEKYTHSLKFNYVRDRARSWSRKLGRLDHGCEICLFDFSVQVCHIKAIKDHSEDTLLNVVNHPGNLIILCPNCHWLFDHHSKDISKIKEYLRDNNFPVK